MKKRVLFFLLAMPMLLTAAQSDLASKIARLQNAPKSERFKLMNEIKRELARMNAEQRNKALRKLRASMHGGTKGDGHRKGMGKSMHHISERGEKMRQKMHQHQEMVHRHEMISPERGGEKNEHRPTPQHRPQPGKNIPFHDR